MILKRIWSFYYDGFRGMSVRGKKLWIIIFIKLFIMFAILKVFFFPNILKDNFKTDQERIHHIEQQIIITNDK